MPDRLRNFLAAVRAARDDNAAERRQLIGRLKALTPEQFVQVSRQELQQLSDRDYLAIVRHIAPDHRIQQPHDVRQKKPRRWSVRPVWNAIPSFLRASIVGFTIGFLILGGSLALGPAIDRLDYETPPVRPTDASLWPHCARLSPWVDGCTYVPTTNLAWAQAASLLAMPVAKLREGNQHIDHWFIPAGSLLIVWRYRGSLQGGE